jgi:AbrB family looped-hinge helix DNA binding protein
MPSATITSKGQVTIPKKVRDQLQLKPGDTINFEIDSSSSAKLTTERKDHSEVFGMFKHKTSESFTVEEMDDGVAEYFRNKYSAE